MGRATALLFAKEGAKVVGSDINAGNLEAVVAEATVAGGTMIGVAGDISRRADAEARSGRAIEEYGKLDALANNAHIMDLREGVATVENEPFASVIAVTLCGP